MAHRFDQFRIGLFGKIERFEGLIIGWFETIDTSAGFVPVVARVDVCQTTVVPVGEVHAAIRAHLDINRAEPAVLRHPDRRHIFCSKSGCIRNQIAGHHAVMQ